MDPRFKKPIVPHTFEQSIANQGHSHGITQRKRELGALDTIGFRGSRCFLSIETEVSPLGWIRRLSQGLEPPKEEQHKQPAAFHPCDTIAPEHEIMMRARKSPDKAPFERDFAKGS